MSETKLVVAAEAVKSWSDLPLDIVDMVASRLSFKNYIRFLSVCKHFYSATNDARVPWPQLLYLSTDTTSEFKLFDPINGKQDAIEYDFPVTGRLNICSAKDEWVLMIDSEEDGYTEVFMVNTFMLTEEFVNLPSVETPCDFSGISFSSPPTDSDCIVMGIFGQLCDDSEIEIYLWRPGKKDWSKKEFVNNVPYVFSQTNPVFHNGKFYCLGRYGNLGTFDPISEEWTVLDKPKPILYMHLDAEDRAVEDLSKGDECYYFVESFRGHLLCIFFFSYKRPLLVMKLDESKMAWVKVADLKDETIFVDQRNSISVEAPIKRLENRIYLTRFLCHGDELKECVYYCMRSKKYHRDPKYKIGEKVHRTWVKSRV